MKTQSAEILLKELRAGVIPSLGAPQGTSPDFPHQVCQAMPLWPPHNQATKKQLVRCAVPSGPTEIEIRSLGERHSYAFQSTAEPFEEYRTSDLMP